MFQSGLWFAWYPVKASARGKERYAWLETVFRDRVTTKSGTGAWRYYTMN